MAKDRLSKRQQSIYDFICSYTTEHGYPPSVREIGTAVGLASPSTVHMHLKVLQERGLIKRDSKKKRTIEVVEDDLPGGQALASVEEHVSEGTISLPLIGRVAAGTPILAEQNVEDVFSFPRGLLGTAEDVFMLRIQGDSMINVGIFDGDFVLVRQQPTVTSLPYASSMMPRMARSSWPS